MKPTFRVENIQPILNVNDIDVSLQFYVGILGFKNADWGDDDFTSVILDNACIYLCKNGQGNVGTWVWIGFDGDIYSLHECLKSSGVKINMPPTNFPWALEMHVEDPDGHVLRFGTDPEHDS